MDRRTTPRTTTRTTSHTTRHSTRRNAYRTARRTTYPTTATTAIPTVYEYDVSTHVLYTFNAVIATCAAVEGAMKWAQE
ncbi:hypothetical protein L917_18420, partial [Phytophthora nicotianae]